MGMGKYAGMFENYGLGFVRDPNELRVTYVRDPKWYGFGFVWVTGLFGSGTKRVRVGHGLRSSSRNRKEIASHSRQIRIDCLILLPPAKNIDVTNNRRLNKIANNE